MKKNKVLAFLFITIFTIGCSSNKLPKPQITDGIRGEMFGIDKNINEETIDKYLNRNDTVYKDMRMLIDPANYQEIGGDSYLSGLVSGFQVVPLPYLVTVRDLPEVIGTGYQGPTLYTLDDKGQYLANYKQSFRIIEDLFPKNKNIFLMCGGGGYAGMTKQLLIELGWDENKIYNVGGYWYYRGNNNVSIKRTENGVDFYDFWKVPYHNIDFLELEEIQ